MTYHDDCLICRGRELVATIGRPWARIFLYASLVLPMPDRCQAHAKRGRGWLARA